MEISQASPASLGFTSFRRLRSDMYGLDHLGSIFHHSLSLWRCGRPRKEPYNGQKFSTFELNPPGTIL